MDRKEGQPKKSIVNDGTGSFPPLNAIITPVAFDTATCDPSMSEYDHKSFEEMRFEYYQKNRRGVHWYDEKNYLKSLPSERWETTPTAASILGDSFAHKTSEATKVRSFLTNVRKQNVVEPALNLALAIKEEPPECASGSPQADLVAQKAEMTARNLERYFRDLHTESCFPPELFSFSSNNCTTGCECPRLAYNYFTVPEPIGKSDTERLLDLFQINRYGCHQLFNRYEPIFRKGSLYSKLFEAHILSEEHERYADCLESKYFEDGNFNVAYFWEKIQPYCTKLKEIRTLNVERKRCRMTHSKSNLLGWNYW